MATFSYQQCNPYFLNPIESLKTVFLINLLNIKSRSIFAAYFIIKKKHKVQVVSARRKTFFMN